jgi:hypothetical protein
MRDPLDGSSIHRIHLKLFRPYRFTVPLFRGDYPTLLVEGLTIWDLRDDRHSDNDQVEAVFREAAGYLQESGGEFHNLVVSYIKTIVVLDEPGERVSWVGRTYSTTLPVRVRRNTFYLASRLVWAAGYIRALAAIPWYRRLPYRRSAQQAGRNSWIAFVRQFPDAEEWVRYLDGHKL